MVILNIITWPSFLDNIKAEAWSRHRCVMCYLFIVFCFGHRLFLLMNRMYVTWWYSVLPWGYLIMPTYIWHGLHVTFVHLIRFTCDVCTSDTAYMWRLYIWYGLHVTFVHLIRLTCDVCTSDTVQTSHVSRIRCTNVTCKPYQMYKRHM
jgi:hypothetical protein